MVILWLEFSQLKSLALSTTDLGFKQCILQLCLSVVWSDYKYCCSRYSTLTRLPRLGEGEGEGEGRGTPIYAISLRESILARQLIEANWPIKSQIEA